MNKEKIIIYNDFFFEVSQTFVYKQVEGLADKYQVDLLGYEFKNPHGYKLDSFKKYEISKPENLFGRAASKIYRRLNKSSLHLDLHSYVLLDNLLCDNNYKAIHAHFGYNGLNILRYARKYNIPLIVTFHGHDASAMLNNDDYRKKLPELFDYAKKIILVSRHMIKKLDIEHWLEKVEIIPCAVDPLEFKSDYYEYSFDDKIRIVHAGRITDKKGVPDLLKVFSNLSSKYNNLELHVAGDGSDLEECKQLAYNLNISEKTIFYGAVTHQEVKSILQKGDIFVLNSRIADNGDMEGTPVTLLEAMCMKKAVVSTKHAGIPYVIKHGFNGLLAEEKNNDQLEKYLEDVIKSKELRHQLGEEAESTVLESYSTEKMQQKIDHIYSEVVHPEKSKSPVLEAVGFHK